MPWNAEVPWTDMDHGDKILSLRSAARRLRISPATLRDGRWRRRAGIPFTKVAGRIVGVAERDLLDALERGRENLDAPNGDEAA